MAAKPQLILLAILACLGQPAHAAETPHYPVWWSSELELDSIKNVEERLQRDLWPEIGAGFELHPNGDPGLASVRARNCDSLLRYSEQGYRALSAIDLSAQRYNLAFCRAIALLGQGRAAQASHLRDFSLDAEAVNYLPALVNLYPSCEFICYAVFANKNRIALANFDEIERIEMSEEDRIAVGTSGWNVEMRLLARGDFSGDGLDDILLLAHGGATEGRYRATDLFVLTRDEPASVLQAINAEQRLCSGYRCNEDDLLDAPGGRGAR